MKILLVDDKKENLYLLEKLLQGNGYETFSAANGAQALEAALKNPPDMIVSDILMPVMDGFTLCREWRKNITLKRIPFVFYTATYTDLKDEEFALSLGADRFIIKPQGMTDFLHIIQETFDAYSKELSKPKPAHAREEQVFLKEYNETLVRRLEEKMVRLEAVEKELREKNAVLEKDIEERKLVEEKIRESEEKYRSIYENSKVAILLTIPDGSVISANEYACELFGMTEEEICRGGREAVVDLTDPRLSNLLEERKRKGHASGEVTLKRKDGTKFEGEISSVFFRDREGNERTSMLIQDLTDRKRAEEGFMKSEARFRSYFEQSIAGIAITSPTKGWVEVNDCLCDMLGYTKEQLREKTWSDLTHTDDLVNDLNHFDRVIQGELDGYTIDKRFIRKDGKIIWTTMSVRCVRLADGNVDYFVALLFDISERKRAEEALKKSEEWFRTLADTTSTAIFIYRGEQFVYANKSLERISGYTKEEILQMRFWDIVHPEYRVLIRERGLARQRGEQVSDRYEFKIIRKDGTERWIDFTAGIIEWQGKTAAIGSAFDITERRQMEEKVRESEEYYRTLVETSPDAIFITDPTGHTIYISEKTKEVFGLSPSHTVIGKSILDWVVPDERKNVMARIQDILSGQFQSEIREYRLRKDNQTPFWGEIASSPLMDAEGKVTGLLIICRDITERKEAEETLRETRDYLENLLSFANAPIIVWDPNFKITRFNLALEKLTGYTIYEVVGKNLEMLFPPESRKSSLSLFATTSEGDHLITVEVPLQCKNGSIRTILWSTANIYAADGQALVSTIAQGQDITEQKKLQHELIQAQKMESIGTLAGGIAHDFNNILGIILGYSSIMDRKPMTPEQLHESLGIINNAVGRGAALVRQILTFARKTDIVFEPMNVADLIRELLSMLRQTFPKVITFTDIIDTNIPFIVADRTQIHQMMLNLCVNARDAMPNGGTITIKAEKQTKDQVQQRVPAADQDSYICLSVTDTGEGMSETTRRQIFDPFFTTKEKGKGTGLGLAVVYGAVQSHHGLIDVESELAHGTTFRLYFPISAESKLSADVASSLESFTAGGTETILLVEDEEALLEMVRFMLESNGYKVLTAQDGNEAITLYKQHKQEIDIVLTDMGLPGMAGMNVFMKLNEINPGVNVIVASGFFGPDIKSKLEKLGVKGFIQKPYSPDEVLQILRMVLDAKNG